MKYYIATKLERHADHNRVRDAMAVRGHEITYDWSAHGAVYGRGKAGIREVALAEKRGVLEADIVIVLLPGGRGTHAELGMALAAGIPVVVHSTDPQLFEAVQETCAFYHDPLCYCVATADVADIVAWPESWAAAHVVRRQESADFDPIEAIRARLRASRSRGGPYDTAHASADIALLLDLVDHLEDENDALHAEVERLTPAPVEPHPSVERAMARFRARLAELEGKRLQEDDGEPE